MLTKIDIITDAYSQMRISGLTVQPTVNDIRIALSRLEAMMAELEVRTICLGYNFEETPDTNTESGVILGFLLMMSTNLALRLIPDFNKQIPDELRQKAKASLSLASSFSAKNNLRQVQYPSRQPIGGANVLRFASRQRYYHPEPNIPSDCKTRYMKVGDINDFTESYKAYLKNETIASYILTATSSLTKISYSNTDDVISYRLKATGRIGTNYIKIVMTTSSGRINTRQVVIVVDEIKISN
ncbi:MAG: packaged DNA stabilization gp4 family protein [Thiohalomonadales bacterium]